MTDLAKCTFNKLNETLTTEERDAFADTCRSAGIRGEVGSIDQTTGMHFVMLWPRHMRRSGIHGRRYRAASRLIKAHAFDLARTLLGRHGAGYICDRVLFSYFSTVGESREDLPKEGASRVISGSTYRIAQVGHLDDDVSRGWVLLRLERIEENTIEEERRP